MLQQINLIDLTQHLPTPFLVIDLAEVQENISRIRRALPQAEVFYAVKCNADRRVLESVQQANGGFEVASFSEAEAVLQLGVPPERIICLHPIKSPDFLRFLHRHRIDVLAADSVSELDKLAEYAPGSRVVLRVNVSNEGSVFPLNRKFGVEPKEAISLFHCAASRGLVPYGITIHVGSQCERLETWRDALAVCQQVFHEAKRANIKLSLLSLGGGLPAAYAKDSLSLNKVGAVICEAIARLELPADCTLSIEPGRAVVASAGTFITTVIGLAERAEGKWAYLDAGVYHGLFEACPPGGGIPFPISVNYTERPLQIYKLGGPTCDGFDLPFEKRSLPELHIGDRLLIHFAGAYSTALSSTFNGFSVPAIHYLDDVATELSAIGETHARWRSGLR